MKNFWKILGICSVIGFHATNAFAQVDTQNKNIILDIPNQKFDVLKSQLSFCANESDAKMRLMCYETSIKEAGIPIYKSSKFESSNSWATKSDNEHKDWLAAVQSVNIGVNGKKTLMSIRCTKGKTALYFLYNSPVGGSPIQIDIGSDETSLGQYQFKPSESQDALGLWESNQAIMLSKYIASLKEKVLVKTHFKDGIETDTFYITGSSQALTDVRRSCDW